MFTIGELSRITRLTVKTLRFYHDKGILIPDRVDVNSKYRYYRSDAVERAETIGRLKDMGFSITEIQHILTDLRDDLEVVGAVREKLKEIEGKINEYQEMKRNLSMFLQSSPKPVVDLPVEAQLEDVPGVWIAGIRYRGRYDGIGARFRELFKVCGRHVAGSPFALYYDREYMEPEADIEACVPVTREIRADGISYRFLEGGQGVALLHKGPYQEIGRSYRLLFEYCRQNEVEWGIPIRECYLKGPGVILKGNPARYVTKLMVLRVQK